MTTINPSQQVFALFYAIMWGTLANVWPRWRAFDWAQVVRPGERAITVGRCLLSILMLNALPILFFVLVFMWLEDWVLDGTWWQMGYKLVAIMIQPFTLVGFYWVWTSIIQCFRPCFYPTILDPKLFPNLNEHDLDRKGALPNFVFGLLYVLVPIAALALVRCVQR